MHHLLVFLLAAAAFVDGRSVRDYSVEWTSLTPFSGSQYSDAMPGGNGRVQTLSWGNATNGGLSFYLRSPLAQHTDSMLYTIALIEMAISPNPLSAPGAYVNQTLNLEDGSVTLLAGGSSFADYTLNMTLYVDANSDTVVVFVASVAPVNLTVSMLSVRPSPTSYQLPFVCNTSSSSADVIVPNFAAGGGVALYHLNNATGGGGTPPFTGARWSSRASPPLLTTLRFPTLLRGVSLALR